MREPVDQRRQFDRDIRIELRSRFITITVFAEIVSSTQDAYYRIGVRNFAKRHDEEEQRITRRPQRVRKVIKAKPLRDTWRVCVGVRVVTYQIGMSNKL